jgi:hypothetical protein
MLIWIINITNKKGLVKTNSLNELTNITGIFSFESSIFTTFNLTCV